MAEPEAGSIRTVDPDTVHFICSGQVVLDLASAVKELLENALDAGASNVEIRLKEHGTKLIEVIDNGCGVQEADFAALTMKHCTSKLTNFREVYSVSTFGFRGEALSSLCALCSQVVITTRHRSSAIGSALYFDKNGRIVQQKQVAHPFGTLVTVHDLFGPLPVRRKEFLRNSKREFAKMCHIVQAYCLVSINKRICCVDQNSQGKRINVMMTKGNASVQQNVEDLFGHAQLKHLVPVTWTVEDTILQEAASHFQLSASQTALQLAHIEGLISSCAHGEGRASGDRQFFFVNGRPCDAAKLSRVVGDCYHHFNRHQSPFVCLDIRLPRDKVDVNMTPDKRQLLFEQDKVVFAALRSALWVQFEQISSSYQVQQVAPAQFEDSGEARAEAPDAGRSACMVSDLRARFQRYSCSSRLEASVITPQSKRRKVQTPASPAWAPAPCKVALTKTPAEEGYATVQPEAITAIVQVEEDMERLPRRTVLLPFCIAALERCPLLRSRDVSKPQEDGNRRFLARICPSHNEAAEEELRKIFHQDDFRRLDIYGQFNLGFVIAGLGKDLFIIDQHASDEKYNFERLEQASHIQTQRLVVKQPLDLLAIHEDLLIQNVAVFQANGFDFQINLDAEPRHRVFLTQIPYSKSWTFGKSDIDEMIFMLSDTDHDDAGLRPACSGVLRPSRMRSMFASRACRSSVMIGTALSRTEMRRLVDNMAEMRHPWNCPHGRPTMRHLIHLSMLP